MAQLILADNQLKQAFASKKDDEKALRRALKIAKDVGLTSGYSLTVRDVEAHLRKVVVVTWRTRITPSKYRCIRITCSIYIHKITSWLGFWQRVWLVFS